MELIALFLLLVVGLSLFKRWWWISVFVPKYKDETVSMFVRWPWRCRLFNNKCGRKIIRFVSHRKVNLAQQRLRSIKLCGDMLKLQLSLETRLVESDRKKISGHVGAVLLLVGNR